VTAHICHAYPYRDCGNHHCSEIFCSAEVAAIVSDELREPCEVSALTRLPPGSHKESWDQLLFNVYCLWSTSEHPVIGVWEAAGCMLSRIPLGSLCANDIHDAFVGCVCDACSRHDSYQRRCEAFVKSSPTFTAPCLSKQIDDPFVSLITGRLGLMRVLTAISEPVFSQVYL